MDWWFKLIGWFSALVVPRVPISALADASLLDDTEAVVTQLYDWERDRLMTLAKGTGGAAVSTAALIVTASITNVQGSKLDWPIAIGVTVLVMGLLLWAGVILIGLRTHSEELAAALALVRRTP
jgi:hypothetical protein